MILLKSILLGTLNSDMPGKIAHHVFSFGSTSATETYNFGTTYPVVPIYLSGRVGTVSLANNSRITAISLSTTGITITRDGNGSYAGTQFDVLLFVPD